MRNLSGIILIFLMFIGTVVSAAQRPPQGIGLGVIVGEPTGFSGKYWTGKSTAIDAAAAWSFSGDDQLHLHTDYLIHKFRLVAEGDVDFPLYYGLGAMIRVGNAETLGIRVPFGISYQADRNPLEVFLELVPVFSVVPDTDFDFNAGLGIRIYFR